ncbi:hypothetical protein RND71_026543 [Anisodus tanguticus]|uniref:Uncharacterized protein n=1 Tax=Anisodus tanguticus TaxID=243964 RepID=A0AAE1RNG4_9SOLA|nr:hypothetical protein RND71_026543 [Anisodus tanguticus]
MCTKKLKEATSIKYMREMYLPELYKLYQKIASMVQQRLQHEQIEKLKVFKMKLECIVPFLWLYKHEIQLSHKEKLPLVEKQISFFFCSERLRKPASSPLQGKLPQSPMQQNNYNSLQQQQQLLNQQNNFQNMHQQQLGSQSNIAGVQQQQLSRSQQPGNAGLTCNQQPINMLQQSKVPVQQQMLQSTTTLLPSQGQQSQSQPAQKQMMSHSQSQPGQLQPPLGLHHQTNQLQREMQQRLQTSGPLLQQQNVMEQQKQLYQSQRAAPEASSSGSGSAGKSQKAKEPGPLELRVEQELPHNTICLMDCEAARILQGIQEKMVLSKDPAIKLLV